MTGPVKTLVAILFLLSVAVPVARGTEFIRGDVDGDGDFAVLVDAIFLLEYAYMDGDTPPCLKAADTRRPWRRLLSAPGSRCPHGRSESCCVLRGGRASDWVDRGRTQTAERFVSSVSRGRRGTP